MTRSISVFLAAGLLLGQAPNEEVAPKAIYEQTMRSTCWVRVPKTFGTGTLVDKSKKLVLTSCHVVLKSDTATVWFPIYDGKGKPIVDRAQFEKQGKPLRGKVIARDASRDLALIELESLPDGVVEIKLAQKSAAVGSKLHSVGNGQSNGGLFGYHAGHVRQICQRRDTYSGVTIDCRVLESQSPHNPGDSGGPTVNDKGQLVAVTASYVTTAQLVSFHIDVSEVREFLEKARKK